MYFPMLICVGYNIKQHFTFLCFDPDRKKQRKNPTLEIKDTTFQTELFYLFI